MIPKEWLVEQVHAGSVQAYEANLLVERGVSQEVFEQLLSKGPAPRWQGLWEKFIGGIIPGDELWYFESPMETWNDLSGRAGYALVRGGVVVEAITSRRS